MELFPWQIKQREQADTPVSVRIVDTQTGQQASTRGQQRLDGMPFRWWHYGNGCCDCNRALVFNMDDYDGCELEEDRFIIVSCDPMPEGFTIEDLNCEYPAERIREWLDGREWPLP